jgi:hypothetical protein
LKHEKRYAEEPKNKHKKVWAKIGNWDINELKYRLSHSPNERWIESAFSPADTSFVYSQVLAQVDTIWRSAFENSKIIKKQNNKRRQNRFYYSLPLFSADKKFVIISVSYFCGSLCGYSSYKIYKRLQEGWEYLGEVNAWIS